MRQLNTAKYFIIITLLVSGLLPDRLQANTNPRDTRKNGTEPQAEEQVQPDDAVEQERSDEDKAENDEGQEEDRSKTYNSSLNYFFYMIYKAKFENIFKFPDRSSPQNNRGINLININSLLEYFNHPKVY